MFVVIPFIKILGAQSFVRYISNSKSWMDSGIKLSTPSNEAAKLFDASISQLSGWYDDKQLGGLEATMTKMLEADPQFIGGRSMIYAFEAVGGANVNNNPTLKTNVEQLIADVAADSNCDKWEKLHVKALEHLSSSSIDAAIRQWEEILVEYPSDILSLHLTGLTCLMTGRLDRIGDISGRVLPSFKDEFSLSTAHAWHSFGLSEINLTTQAEWHARKALTIDPKNGWSTHALAHVFEMTSRSDEGIAYMNQGESQWNFSNHIAGHNYWHWGLYYLTKGDFESAIDVLENRLINRAGFDSLSLSYLLSMENLSIDNVLSKHSERIDEIVKPFRADSVRRSFIDAHVMMGLCASKKYDEAEQFMVESIACEDLHGKSVNENLLRSILSYSREKYDECVELLWPIRHHLKQIGGSEAQRDVFSLMLINAALRSYKLEHKRLAGQLIEEREIHRSKSPLIDRLRDLM